MSKKWVGFCCGFAYVTGTRACSQDVYGLDRYIDVVRANWIDTHWSVGAAMAIVALVVFAMTKDEVQ